MGGKISIKSVSTFSGAITPRQCYQYVVLSAYLIFLASTKSLCSARWFPAASSYPPRQPPATGWKGPASIWVCSLQASGNVPNAHLHPLARWHSYTSPPPPDIALASIPPRKWFITWVCWPGGRNSLTDKSRYCRFLLHTELPLMQRGEVILTTFYKKTVFSTEKHPGFQFQELFGAKLPPKAEHRQWCAAEGSSGLAVHHCIPCWPYAAWPGQAAAWKRELVCEKGHADSKAASCRELLSLLQRFSHVCS